MVRAEATPDRKLDYHVMFSPCAMINGQRMVMF
jgi:hypothetical protein